MVTTNKSVIKFLREIGHKGGSVRSEKKTAACKLNGLKGGRPIGSKDSYKRKRLHFKKEVIQNVGIERQQ